MVRGQEWKGTLDQVGDDSSHTVRLFAQCETQFISLGRLTTAINI